MKTEVFGSYTTFERNPSSRVPLSLLEGRRFLLDATTRVH
jgi:hypothetical protein